MAAVATLGAISYHFFKMLPALSEPIVLQPGAVVRLERVAQLPTDPVPERFLHFHGLAELVFIEEGSGACFSEVGAIPFAPGTVLMVPPMAIHDFEFDQGPRRWTLLQFDAQVADPERALITKQAHGTSLEPRSQRRVQVLLEWLSDIIAVSATGRDIVIVLQSLLLALRADFNSAGVSAQPEDNQLGRFRPYLQQAMDQPNRAINLSEAATLCRLSPPYFSKIFRETFGCGFSVYQNQVRLQQAARLLATGRAPVSQVAYRVGFRSHAYFSKCFKALFGISPTDFQKAQRGRRAD